jgi:ABC-type multidrug transport system ATPase subunit
MAELIVDVEGIAKRYRGGGGVSGVTLQLKRGELLGLVGANGGGKTTTLRILGGLLVPDAGAGCVLGYDLRSDRPDRRRIGYMGQRLSLYPDLTAFENLRFHAAAHGLARDAVDAAVTRFGLAEAMAKRVGTLSGGWARRVQFAASLIHEPPLILLDEPTAGLDAVTRRQLWTWLADLAGGGHAVVVSTHDLAEAAALPAIALFHGGTAQPVTTPAAMLASTGTASLEDAVVRVALQ